MIQPSALAAIFLAAWNTLFGELGLRRGSGARRPAIEGGEAPASSFSRQQLGLQPHIRAPPTCVLHADQGVQEAYQELMGILSEVHEGGGGLYAGERQRLCLQM